MNQDNKKYYCQGCQTLSETYIHQTYFGMVDNSLCACKLDNVEL